MPGSTEGKRRKCGPKVRTGCQTCKIRKIKCGEEKPACLRCTSTGRKCDGYLDLHQASRSQRSLQSVHDFPSLANRNQSVMNHFSGRTLYRVAGFFQQDLFWKRFILQLSQSEPAISKALSAVNTASIHIETGQLNLNDRSVAQSYNEAIQALAHCTPDSVYIPLAGCILLVCLEFLRGDMRAALTHIRYGWKVLESSKHESYGQTSSEQDLMTELSSMFERLNVHALLFEPLGNPIAKPVPIPQDTPPASQFTFSTLAEAKSRSYELGSEGMRLVLSTTHLKYHPEAVTLDHVICQIRLETQFQWWHQAFDQLWACQQQAWDQQERKAANIILIQNITMHIWVSTCLSPDETAFDKFQPEFEKIIDLAVQTVGSGGHDLCLSVGKFQFDMGLIPPLHFIGMKCRWPLLRRKVLRILGSTHWREGLFDSFRSYRCLHLLMEIEETESSPDLDPNSAEFEEFRASLPPEIRRIHLAALGPVPISEKQQSLKIISKPNGVFNSAVVWETTIPTFGEIPLLEPWFTWRP